MSKNWFGSNNDPFDHQLWDISFADENNGFVSGINIFLYTSDGGNSWNKKFIPITFCTNIQSRENYIWVTGFGIGYTAIIFSDDNGNNWTPLLVDNSQGINDIFFSDLETGWYCSNTGIPPLYDGFIYKTEKGWLGNIVLPSTPQQVYPANGSITENLFNFEWEKPDYSLYRLQISEDSSFIKFFVITNPSTGDTVFVGNNLYVENKPSVGLAMNKTYYWRVRSENKMGVSDWSETWSFTTSSPTSVREENVPEEFSLYQNYPNPFNPATKIKYTIPTSPYPSPYQGVGTRERFFVSLKVYDILGEEIAVLVNEAQPYGEYEIEFDASGTFKRNLFLSTYRGKFYTDKENDFNKIKETFRSVKIIVEPGAAGRRDNLRASY